MSAERIAELERRLSAAADLPERYRAYSVALVSGDWTAVAAFGPMLIESQAASGIRLRDDEQIRAAVAVGMRAVRVAGEQGVTA